MGYPLGNPCQPILIHWTGTPTLPATTINPSKIRSRKTADLFCRYAPHSSSANNIHMLLEFCRLAPALPHRRPTPNMRAHSLD